MDNYEVKSIYFKKLKGLSDVEFTFSKPLMAIMGVNGSGKTTVIHALACAYQPTDGGNGENHRFSEFFIPNTDALWQGSEFYIENEKIDNSGARIGLPPRNYGKAVDRWTPRYNDRPRRNVYYIGIDTCLPEIEKEKAQTRITYSSAILDDRISKKVNKEAAYILNKDYETLIDNTYHSKHFAGVKLQTGLKYSSLSMGTGEQRTITILKKVLNAELYSLILIDEIDLLLHSFSLKRLVQRLDEIARNRHLQIIFTTHALEMMELTQYVGIQYIQNMRQADSQERLLIYSSISSDLIYNLTGCTSRPLVIYVEDEFAKAAIKKTLRILNMSAKAEVIKYGAIENAFTLAAATVLASSDVNNTLIVLDGDKYRTHREREEQIKKKLVGTERDSDKKRCQALSLISQFNLPKEMSPERFFRDILVQNGKAESELVTAALDIRAVHDSHEWLYAIRNKLNDTEENVVRDIIEIVSESQEWEQYILPVFEWLNLRKMA